MLHISAHSMSLRIQLPSKYEGKLLRHLVIKVKEDVDGALFSSNRQLTEEHFWLKTIDKGGILRAFPSCLKVLN